MSMQVFRCCLFCYVEGQKAGMERMTDGGEDSVASDVGDSTFAVFLQGDVDVGGGDVALLSALLPRPRPAVTFVLLDDVQHLRRKHSLNERTELLLVVSKHHLEMVLLFGTTFSSGLIHI